MAAVLEDVLQLGEEAAKLAAAPLWPLSDDETGDCLAAAYRLEQAAAALQQRLVRQAETRGLPAAAGARNTAGWLRSRLLLDPGPARELAERAAALARQPAVEQALIEGKLDARQATVIAAAADTVAEGLAELGEPSDDLVQQATNTMVDMAARLPAYQLRRIGERILVHVAPHLAERADELALARQEARAHQARGFTMSTPVAGLVLLSGRLGLEDAAAVQAALHPLCTPAPDDKRSPAQRRADALVDVCRLALRTGELPESGGEPAQVAVTVGFDPLTRALGPATSDTGLRFSAVTARRLACDAKILPVVMGGAGQILDLGRSHRLATGALRRALAIRDGGCAFPDCDRPPRWTDAHHVVGWAEGGATSLENLVLLCRRHHRLIHDPAAGWQVRLGADQRPEFIPPADVDPERRARRNLYHPRL
ncbi:HNH endonuclease signature motif containing protein [Paractinoplanes brasiliensis]|uniref:HNH endonuclease n=1 Tax=Paractinoplanes brasiliensis TaxID=52695 RepID=A0A4R6JMB4_9ACTN|nr:HNH endonuclease signature motif containing protein [Actinoplanes brasiliensis]TDO37533.1 HNH endonuclease [Actinoplanes brasiliensis]GID31899.1 HNH endonuclease [Actinoplanes brasiliensis]